MEPSKGRCSSSTSLQATLYMPGTCTPRGLPLKANYTASFRRVCLQKGSRAADTPCITPQTIREGRLNLEAYLYSNSERAGYFLAEQEAAAPPCIMPPHKQNGLPTREAYLHSDDEGEGGL